MKTLIAILMMALIVPLSTFCQDDVWVEVRVSDTVYCMTKERAQINARKVVGYERAQDSIGVLVEITQQQDSDINLLYDALEHSDSIAYNYQSQYQNQKHVTDLKDKVIDDQDNVIEQKDREIFKIKIIAVGAAIGGIIVGILIKALL